MEYPFVQLLIVAFTPFTLIPEKAVFEQRKYLVTKIMKKLHAEDASCIQHHARLGSDDQVVTTSRVSKSRKYIP
jgi:hypothetical protein